LSISLLEHSTSVYNLQVTSVIALFAKAPIAGRVKTRLCPPLTPQEAAEIHLQFTTLMMKKLSSFEAVASIELHTDVVTDAWAGWKVARRLQCEGNLGERMLHALLSAEHVMIVGSDAPALPVDYLREILDSPADVTLGPTEDGGYYAIACRAPVDPRMFDGVRWSTEHTLADTIRAVEACGRSVALGRECWDVDSGEDLQRWRDVSGSGDTEGICSLLPHSKNSPA
jgi:uncharacterized protein